MSLGSLQVVEEDGGRMPGGNEIVDGDFAGAHFS